MMKFDNRILIYFVRKCRKIRKIKIRKRVEKMYIIRKAMEYFKPKINRAYMNEALKKLTEKEKKIFLEMSDYDKFHSLEVYKKIKKILLRSATIRIADGKIKIRHIGGKRYCQIIDWDYLRQEDKELIETLNKGKDNGWINAFL